MRQAIEKAFEWGAVIFGLLLVGSCSVTGFTQSGALTWCMVMCTSAVIALVIVSWVFLVTGTSRDVRTLREQFVERQNPPPARPESP